MKKSSIRIALDTTTATHQESPSKKILNKIKHAVSPNIEDQETLDHDRPVLITRQAMMRLKEQVRRRISGALMTGHDNSFRGVYTASA